MTPYEEEKLCNRVLGVIIIISTLIFFLLAIGVLAFLGELIFGISPAIAFFVILGVFLLVTAFALISIKDSN